MERTLRERLDSDRIDAINVELKLIERSFQHQKRALGSVADHLRQPLLKERKALSERLPATVGSPAGLRGLVERLRRRLRVVRSR
jgi:hypothetical protein